MSTWNSRTSVSTSWTGRPGIPGVNSYLLTNGGSFLLTNGTDKLIISTAVPGSVWNTRIIPS